MVRKYGDHYSWANAARAKLFASLQSSAVDEISFQSLMRHNRYDTDDVGTQGCKHGRSASNAIAERGVPFYVCLSYIHNCILLISRVCVCVCG